MADDKGSSWQRFEAWEELLRAVEAFADAVARRGANDARTPDEYSEWKPMSDALKCWREGEWGRPIE